MLNLPPKISPTIAEATSVLTRFACDFRIVGLKSDRLVEWILEQQLPFDSLYYYGGDRPIHISYAPQEKRNVWAFTDGGVPTRKGIEQWIS